MAGRFDGKRAFVTGASSGIGAAVAAELARQGARVALAARSQDKLEAVQQAIEQDGGSALVAVCDVTDRASLDAAVAQTLETFGGIDLVLANAGFGVHGPFPKLTTDDFRRQFATNFFGVLDTVYATLPALTESKGQLGLVGSVMGRVALPLSAPYATSKFAVCGLAESLHYDLANRGITVTCVNPGVVDSNIRMTDNQGVFRPDRKDTAPAWLIVPTDKAARAIVRGLASGKFEVIVTGHGRLIAWLGRYFPRTYRAIMRYGAKRESTKGEKG